MTKVRKMKKPRATHVHSVLVAKVCAVHEAKVGHKAKRAKQKQQARKELQDI